MPDTQRYLDLKVRLRAWVAARWDAPDEVVDEAFTRALFHTESGPPLRSFLDNPQHEVDYADWPLPRLLAFLIGVAALILLEKYRERRQRQLQPFDDRELEVPDRSATPLARLIEKERDEVFDKCLASLEDNQRAAVAMRLAGYSYEEIAAKLGVKQTRAANWIRRGLKRLTDCVRTRMANRPAPPTKDDEDQS